MPSPPLADKKQHCPRSTRIRSPIDKSIRYLKTLNSLANCLSRLLLLPLLCRIHFLPSIGSSSMAIQLFSSLLSQLDQSCLHKAKTGLSPPSAFLHPPQGTFLIMAADTFETISLHLCNAVLSIHRFQCVQLAEWSGVALMQSSAGGRGSDAFAVSHGESHCQLNNNTVLNYFIPPNNSHPGHCLSCTEIKRHPRICSKQSTSSNRTTTAANSPVRSHCCSASIQ